MNRRVSLSVNPPLPSSTITFQKYDLPDVRAILAGVLLAVAVSIPGLDRLTVIGFGSQSFKVNCFSMGQMHCLYVTRWLSRSAVSLKMKGTGCGISARSAG